MIRFNFTDTPGEWALTAFVLLIAFIVTWFAMQAIYSPVPGSESPSLLKLYKNQGCTLEPQFIPNSIVVLEHNRLKQIPFDSFDHEIVLFCP